MLYINIFSNHFTKTRRYVSVGPYVTSTLNPIEFNQSYLNQLSKPLVTWLHTESSSLSLYALFWDPLMKSGSSHHGLLKTPWASLPSYLYFPNILPEKINVILSVLPSVALMTSPLLLACKTLIVPCHLFIQEIFLEGIMFPDKWIRGTKASVIREQERM